MRKKLIIALSVIIIIGVAGYLSYGLTKPKKTITETIPEEKQEMDDSKIIEAVPDEENMVRKELDETALDIEAVEE